MTSGGKRYLIEAWLRKELQFLVTFHASDRRWQMPFCAALATGLLLLVGAYFGHLDYGLVSSLGGQVFLYSPNTKLSHRMGVLMGCAFGMIASYTLGVLSHFIPVLQVPVLTFIAALVLMMCRFYGIGLPGGLFFIMAAAIGSYSPIPLLQTPLFVGLLAMGALLACLIALFYGFHAVRQRAPEAPRPLPPASFDYTIFDSIVIAAFVSLSLALAQALQLERPYWVPISCLAIIEGQSLRAVWTKQLHRIVGTCLGLVVAWGLLTLPFDTWGVSLLMMALAFIVETLVVRHYGLAVVFITPLSIFLAEAARMGHSSPDALLQARFLDTILGCGVGVIGGLSLHSPRFRKTVGGWLRHLAPPRLRS